MDLIVLIGYNYKCTNDYGNEDVRQRSNLITTYEEDEEGKPLHMLIEVDSAAFLQVVMCPIIREISDRLLVVVMRVPVITASARSNEFQTGDRFALPVIHGGLLLMGAGATTLLLRLAFFVGLVEKGFKVAARHV